MQLGYCIVAAGCNWYLLDINIYFLLKKRENELRSERQEMFQTLGMFRTYELNINGIRKLQELRCQVYILDLYRKKITGKLEKCFFRMKRRKDAAIEVTPRWGKTR
jgi:coenzyme F420-reducing hydrogenase beta subunit